MLNYAYITLPILAVVFLAIMVRYHRLKMRQIQEQLRLQAEVIAANRQYVEHAHMLQHDIHNHIYAIEELIRRGNRKEAEAYLADLRRRIDSEYESINQEEL